MELVHQLLVNLQAAGGIDDDIVVAVVLGVAHSLLGGEHRVLGAPLEHRGPGLLPHHLQLFDSRGAVDVAGHQQGAVALGLQLVGQLGGVGGFTGALQAAHHDDGRRVGGHFQPLLAAAHQAGQLLVDDFDDHLGGGEALHHLAAHGAVGDFLGELFGHLVVDIGFQQGQAHFPHGFLYVRLGELALAAQLFKGIAKLFRQTLECHWLSLLEYKLWNAPGGAGTLFS